MHRSLKGSAPVVVAAVVAFSADFAKLVAIGGRLERRSSVARARMPGTVSSVDPPSAFGSAPFSSSRSTRSSCPLMMATSKGVARSGLFSFTSAPAASIALTQAMSPLRTAKRNGVVPPFDRAPMSAPPSMSACTTGAVRFGGRPHQRGLSVPGLLRVDVGAGNQECLDRIDFSASRSEHQRRFSRAHLRVGIGAGLQQLIDDCGVAVSGGENQRRHTIVVGGLDVGARANQQRGRFHVFAIRRPVQGRRTIGLRRVDVGFLFQQRLHRRLVAALHGVGQLGFFGNSRRIGGAHGTQAGDG